MKLKAPSFLIIFAVLFLFSGHCKAEEDNASLFNGSLSGFSRQTGTMSPQDKNNAGEIRRGKGYTLNEQESINNIFKNFCGEWIEIKNNPVNKNIQCRKYGNFFVAEYTDCSYNYNTCIKQTDCKDSPYIGLLKYTERKYRNRAETFEDAINGIFEVSQEYPVTEIFRYSKGEWQY